MADGDEGFGEKSSIEHGWGVQGVNRILFKIE